MQSTPTRINNHDFNNPANEDKRIIDFVQQTLTQAIEKSASDIHFEPYKTNYRIRIRVDGILHALQELSLDWPPRVTARLKVMSKLDIAERRLPQDGRFTLAINNHTSRDCRISTCPTLFGEKIVIRFLDINNIALDIDSLGFTDTQKDLFMQSIQKPQGMLLVTGPTGSGKTLSLYTALKQINTLEKNISTVEDPVEIELPGINQISINTKIDFTFAKALRSLLRQDPDVIMIGEIRDQETADIATKAAQTGHLVLSTLHTNSAAEAINRLVMMDVSAFNLAQSLLVIIAQRLVRKLCEHCKKPNNAGHHATFQAVGCPQCMNGYYGRVGLFEFLPVTSTIVNMIVQHKTALEITQTAKNSGMISLQEAALNKIQSGVTSAEEVARVIL
jgi:type IV pilus assembly protein PilB